MTEVWIAIGAIVAAAAVGVWLVLRRRRAFDPAAPAWIESIADSTAADASSGAVRSVQRADLVIDSDALAEIWSPTHLERLARTYWRFLPRVTLGLVHVHYTDTTRSVVLLTPPFRLLTFAKPVYRMDATSGVVVWHIARGLLVARKGRGRGYLQIEVRRSPHPDPRRERLSVEVEVANFYPAIASAISLRLYNVTQSRIHVIVTKSFLRSLTRLDLAESRVGQLAAPA
jgi:hypothetical protein